MKNRPQIKDLKGQIVTEIVEASPLAPVDEFFKHGNYEYWLAFVPQNVRDADVEKLEALEQKKLYEILALPEIKTFLKENNKDSADGLTVSQLLELVPAEHVSQILELQNGQIQHRSERVKAYASAIVEWNVPDLDGNDLPLGEQAFLENSGVYDAALLAAETAFLKFKTRTAEAAPATENPSLAGGDTPSSAPAKKKATAVSDTSLPGPSNSG